MQAVQLRDVNLSGKAAEKAVDVSVVIPVGEGHGDVREIYAQYARALVSSGYSCEFIFVIDGSGRRGIESERRLKELGPAIRVITLNRSFGEAAALSFGFEKARAPVIVTLPAYFQVEPREICEVIKTLAKNDMDLVISRRFPLPDRLFARLRSRVFHRLVRIVSGSTYQDLACGLRAMKRKVADSTQ